MKFYIYLTTDDKNNNGIQYLSKDQKYVTSDINDAYVTDIKFSFNNFQKDMEAECERVADIIVNFKEFNNNYRIFVDAVPVWMHNTINKVIKNSFGSWARVSITITKTIFNKGWNNNYIDNMVESWFRDAARNIKA